MRHLSKKVVLSKLFPLSDSKHESQSSMEYFKALKSDILEVNITGDFIWKE